MELAKDRICNECKYYNNGWCKARKTNKGLRDLIECEFKRTNKVDVAKDESLKKLMICAGNEEDKFWGKFFNDESVVSDLLDDAIRIMTLQKGIIQNLLAKIEILSS